MTIYGSRQKEVGHLLVKYDFNLLVNNVSSQVHLCRVFDWFISGPVTTLDNTLMLNLTIYKQTNCIASGRRKIEAMTWPA